MTADNKTLGTILVDGNGMTLYIFTKDSAGKSACTGACAQKWPALTVKDMSATPKAGDGVTGKLGVMQRDDGSFQVTYNDMPLYYYAQDKQAGDAAGQGVGTVWFAVTADGKPAAAK